nr:nucleoside recognition domain-containing protein [Melioribacter roseus]
MTTTYLLFLLLPLVIGFYFVMALLEDSGYLPRLATMLDRTFNKIGLNGKAVIPIILGFGCITMANITTRLLGSEREKSIATAILQFVIPCSAQLAVITVLLSGAGLTPLLIFIGVIGSVLIILSTVLNKLIPGQSSPLLIDLPIMRLPRISNVFKKMTYRSYGFMKEAGFWFFVGALAVGVMDITGLLLLWQDILAPLTTHWLKLPKEAANAFVMGMVRRDFGAAGLFAMNLTVMQITVAIITITLFTPCIASFVVMLKERGWKEGLTIWLGTWVTAFFIGGLVAQFIV